MCVVILTTGTSKMGCPLHIFVLKQVCCCAKQTRKPFGGKRDLRNDRMHLTRPPAVLQLTTTGYRNKETHCSDLPATATHRRVSQQATACTLRPLRCPVTTSWVSGPGPVASVCGCTRWRRESKAVDASPEQAAVHRARVLHCGFSRPHLVQENSEKLAPCFPQAPPSRPEHSCAGEEDRSCERGPAEMSTSTHAERPRSDDGRTRAKLRLREVCRVQERSS